jgi:hypothetical protein
MFMISTENVEPAAQKRGKGQKREGKRDERGGE